MNAETQAPDTLPTASSTRHTLGSSAGSPGRRILAMILRYWYLLRGSVPRMLELIYWPTVQMVLWGFISSFFMTHSSWVAQAAGILISGVLLWDSLFRAQLGLSISFLEDLWSRNLGHLFVSPLRPTEWVAALMTISLIRTLFGFIPASILAVVLYQYSIFEMGLPLVAFFLNLIIMGWALGLMIIAAILRLGLGAESLAWVAVFILAPLSAVYYPVDSLPTWLHPISLALPSTHVFEGMRAAMFDQVFATDHFFKAVAWNVLYMLIGMLTFLRAHYMVRVRGGVLNQGE